MNGPYADVSIQIWFTLSVHEQSLILHKEFYHNYKLFTTLHSLPITLMSLNFRQLESDNKRQTYLYRCTMRSYQNSHDVYCTRDNSNAKLVLVLRN